MRDFHKRKFPLRKYFLFIVEPVGEFSPDDWRQRPKDYRILESHGFVELAGKRDAWRWLHNHAAWTNGTSKKAWAIYVG